MSKAKASGRHHTFPKMVMNLGKPEDIGGTQSVDEWQGFQPKILLALTCPKFNLLT